jgi:hypothetical protein
LGIVRQVNELFANEHAYKRMEGKFCCFGRQTVSINKDVINQIFTKYKLSQETSDLVIDTDTRHSNETITDYSFLNLFDVSDPDFLDISDYEGANIICDLNTDVPKELEEKYDFVYTGGCHDNVFNPAQLLMNSTKLIKPGGRVAHYESFSGLIGAYTYLTPEWFYSYYAINNFSDCKVYVCHQTEQSESRFNYKTDIYLFNPYYNRNPDFNYFDAAVSAKGIMYIMVIAEKGSSSTHDKMPIQLQYLDSNTEDWRKQSQIFNSSERPLLKLNESSDNKKEIFCSDHYQYLGTM